MTFKFTQQQRSMIDSMFPNVSELARDTFMEFCEASDLNPFRKQVIGKERTRDDQIQITTTVDGLRMIAERSGQYQGQVAPLWMDAEGAWQEVWQSKWGKPVAAKVGVWRQGNREPVWGVVTWDEFGQDTNTYRQMPSHMLAIRAECLALRKTFPNQIGGIYAQEEMPHDDGPAIPATPPVSGVEAAKQAMKSAGVEIKTGADIEAPRQTFSEQDVNEWLMPMIAETGKTIDDLRKAMKRAKDIDKSQVDLEPTEWPVRWQNRIEKWHDRMCADTEKV